MDHRIQVRGHPVLEIGDHVIAAARRRIVVGIGFVHIGIIDIDLHAVPDQPCRQLCQRAFAQVVGARFEGNADKADLFRPGAFHHRLGAADLCLVGLEHRVQQMCRRVLRLRQMAQGAHVLGQAGAAEGKAGPHEVGRDVDLGVGAENLHHRLPVEAGGLGDIADLVGKGHLDRAPGVRGVFHHLGGAHIDNFDVAGQVDVDRGQDVCGALIQRAEDDQAGIVVILDRGALTQEFGVIADAEVAPGDLAACGFQRRDAGVLGRAGDDGRADDHAVVALLFRHCRADVAAGGLDIGQPDRAIRRAGRADGDKGDVAVVDRMLHIVRGRQLAVADNLRNKRIQSVFDDRGKPRIDRLDLPRLDIDRDDLMTVAGQAGR